MNANEQIANIAEQLLAEMSRISLAQAVQSSAYTALAHHLAAQDYVNLEALAKDLDQLGSSHPDEGWQSGHAELAGALRLLNK